MHFSINLTSLAVILWSGMLIIAGSVLVLSSQVRKVADMIEHHSDRASADARLAAATRPTVVPTRVPRASVRRVDANRRNGRGGARTPTT